jgi:hypothetical protein
MREVEAILGPSMAKAAALRAGPFQLEDSLRERLLLEGLSIQPDGELTCLSPGAWRAEAGGLPKNAHVEGILLEPGKERVFVSFVSRWRKPESAGELLALAEHFFFQDSLKVAIRYTEPRFHRP